jgi:rod shape determining protein RodA
MVALFKHVRNIDWFIIIAVMALMTLGILFIYSSGITSTGELVSTEYVKQIIWAISGLFLILIATLVEPKRLPDYTPIIYAVIILVLVYTRMFGRVVNGARSWLGIGDFGIQPSEFMKIATMLFLAKYLDSSKHEGSSVKRFILAFGIVSLPMILILIQPDFGTALVFLPIFLTMAFIGGVNRKLLIYVSLFGAVTIALTILPLWESLISRNPSIVLRVLYDAPFVYYLASACSIICILAIFGYRFFRKAYYYWIAFFSSILVLGLGASIAGHMILKGYQLMRLVVFLDPGVDPLGAGWHILQSVTAIGSGGMMGKGFLQGTQSHYRYLPEQSTDFIFSIMSEELGFIGGITIFILYLFILVRLLLALRYVRNQFQVTFVCGLFGMLLFHFMINVGMTMGIMPITGIPLLFLSYGGSSLWAVSIGLGLALGIGARRYETA